MFSEYSIEAAVGAHLAKVSPVHAIEFGRLQKPCYALLLRDGELLNGAAACEQLPRPGEELKSHIHGIVLLHQLNKLLPLRPIEITME